MIEVLDPELYKRFGEVKVVDADRLHDMTERGWQLICLTQEKRVSMEQRKVPCEGGRGAGASCRHGYEWHCSQSSYRTDPAESILTRYVVARDKDTMLGDLGAKVDELENELVMMQGTLGLHERAVDKATKAMENSEKKLKDSVEVFEGRETRLGDQAARINQHVQTINKMEDDIGKLRREFGDREVARILKPEKDNGKDS